MKLQYKIDLDRDIDNWQKSFSRISYGLKWNKFIPEDLNPVCLKDRNRLSDYVQKKFYKTNLINIFLEWLKKNVDIKQIQADLESITGEKFDYGKIGVYLTTFHRAPYNFQKKYFYLIYQDKNKTGSIRSIYHELFHFYFHEHYMDQIKNKYGSEKANQLKESLTVILNDVLPKRLLPPDKGYPEHKILREQIKRIWQKEKNLDSTIRKTLPYLSHNLSEVDNSVN